MKIKVDKVGDPEGFAAFVFLTALTMLCWGAVPDLQSVLSLLVFAWGLLSLRRVLMLTEPLHKYAGHNKKSLPVRLLGALGIREEERRQAILTHFSHPTISFWLACGLAYAGLVVFCTLKPDQPPTLQALDQAVAAFWAAAWSVPNQEAQSIVNANASLSSLSGVFCVLMPFALMTGLAHTYVRSPVYSQIALLVTGILAGAIFAGVIAGPGFSGQGMTWQSLERPFGSGPGTASLMVSLAPGVESYYSPLLRRYLELGWTGVALVYAIGVLAAGVFLGDLLVYRSVESYAFMGLGLLAIIGIQDICTLYSSWTNPLNFIAWTGISFCWGQCVQGRLQTFSYTPGATSGFSA